MAKKIMEHSKDFDFLNKAYHWGWATKEQIKWFTDNGALTAGEYEEITGEKYPNAK